MLCKENKLLLDGKWISQKLKKKCVCESAFFLNRVTNEISADGQRGVEACYCV